MPTGLRVRVLAIDGLERRMAEHLVAGGEMPALGALLATGARARLTAEPERVPAIVWTTIATGRGPEAHGIQAADTRRITGLRTPVSLDAERSPFTSALGAATDLLRLTRPQPPSAVLRSVKTFWNVASEKGLRVGVVNWWATWPADAVNGWIVTDRAAFKLEKGGSPDREVYPAEAFDRLRPLLDASEPDRARRLDRFHLAATRALRADAPPDLEALYLPGLDIFTMQQLGEAPASDLAGLDSKLAAVRDQYRFVDGLIAEAVAGLGPNDVLVLVGDPGRLARGGTVAAEGLLVLSGAPVAPGDLGAVSERDVAPTVLHLLGLPKSRELDGRVLEARALRLVPPRPPGAPRRLLRPPPDVTRGPERLRPGRPRAAQEPRLHPVRGQVPCHSEELRPSRATRNPQSQRPVQAKWVTSRRSASRRSSRPRR